MEEEVIKQVKMTLRSLVASSPSQMDARRLQRYYLKLLGEPNPLTKLGFRDFVALLRERCSDSILLTGPPSNPILTAIVPASSKHTSKVKTKRRSIPEAKVKPPEQDLSYESYAKRETSSDKDRALSLSQDVDSGKHTLSSSSRTKAINKIKANIQFEKLKSEIMELITAAPEGVWCTDLIRLYRERYNRELNFTRFGYTSILNLAYALEARVQITRPTDTGDWRLAERHRGAGPAAPCPASAPRPFRATDAPPPAPDQDDALPGIDFDPDVFPADCVRFLEQIPALSLANWRPGAMLEVMMGEVYSPSHFWLIILGKNYNIAMEEMMDEMMLYYNGEGRARGLARGELLVGHYCAALYEGDWHRAVIVKIIDSDTVKVRYVDYGTVGAVEARGLRPLLRRWARLPAQAVRARLAGVRPAADGQRWPHAAAAHLMRAVRDARLVANVLAVDTEHDVLETLLIDTRGADDVCLSSSLISAGHANMRADSALRAAECYLDPKFDALERGDTPNLAEMNLPAPVCLPEPACVPLPSAASPPASP